MTSWTPTTGSQTENALARPELRQNDFGGVLGGPITKKDGSVAEFVGTTPGRRFSVGPLRPHECE